MLTTEPACRLLRINMNKYKENITYVAKKKNHLSSSVKQYTAETKTPTRDRYVSRETVQLDDTFTTWKSNALHYQS